MSKLFTVDNAKPGHGIIHLALLPPATPRLRTVQYQYPLKLISPAPTLTQQACLIHIVYLLTYGGGLVAGDSIDLHVTVESDSRLVLLTQGSTKLFKTDDKAIISKQHMTVRIEAGAALCYLPDPVQPFEHSSFEQRQMYQLATAAQGTANLCALDWVSNGRSANGEDWSFHHYCSRNEIVLLYGRSGQRLLVRDNLLLDCHDENSVRQRMHSAKVVGTLLMFGSMMKSLSEFFMAEFRQHPRIGGRQWDADDDELILDDDAEWRAARHIRETQQGLLWTVASVRGCTVVKLAAREVEHGRQWLHDMLSKEGTIERSFGERALLCLR